MTLAKTLIHWYSNNKRELPWRQTKNPYFIWLSEIMLQQTQVKQGLPFYTKFVGQFPTIFQLANARESEVLKLWQGLGYYSRARNLHYTAQYIVNDLNGNFPDNYNDLLKLKGVGDYTASAIASICFNEASPVVDGNVFRFLSRYFNIDTPINTSKGFKQFKKLANELIDKNEPANFNQAIMEFGAVQCKPQNPNCNACPLNISCLALANNSIEDLPVKVKAAPVKKRYFNFLVILSANNQVVLEKRRGKGIWQNLYQFPLVETINEVGLKDIQVLLNQFELLKNDTFEFALYNENNIVHKLSHQHLFVKFWIINLDGPTNNGISFKNIKEYPVPVLIENFIDEFNFNTL